MRTTLALLVGLSIVFAGKAHAQSRSSGGANVYPRTDAQNRAAAQAIAARPTEVRITRNSQRGSIVARGRRLTRQGAGAPPLDAPQCEYNVAFRVEIVEGSREFTVAPQPDCTMLLEDVQDMNVIEPQEALVRGEPQRSLRHVLASLWETFFPRLLAQTLWMQRSVYQHIFTCGAACAGNADGLTAQQSWLYYSQSLSYPYQVQANGMYGWYCHADAPYWNGYRYVTYCQPPLDIPAAPMFPGNTGWRTVAAVIAVREWGPSTSMVRGVDFSEYDWNVAGPQVAPRFLLHRLTTETIGRPQGFSPICNSYIQGSWVAGPVRSYCVVPAP